MLIDADAFRNSLRYHQVIQENNEMRELIGYIIEMVDNQPTLEVKDQIISELQELRKFYYEHQRYDEYAYVGVDESIKIVKQVFKLIEEGDAIE